MSTFGWIATAVVIGGAAYLLLKNKTVSKSIKDKIDDSLRKKIISTSENVDELRMADVISFFKSKNLVKDRDIPFVATVAGFSTVVSLPNKENGYILGIYNEVKDDLTEIKLIYAKSVDEKFKSTIGNEQLVVLT
jgi:hypothetical protein